MANALTELEMRLEMQDLCWGLTDHLAPKWFIETAADFGAVEVTSSSDASPD